MIKGDITNLLNIKQNDMITVVGAGGKTSLINYIASLYRDKKSVLLTTTTKIYVPNNNLYDYMYLTDEDYNINKEYTKGITVIGRYINKEDKIVGIERDELKKIDNKFDLILVEGDGSKKKKLKGWNENEPVVPSESNKTIGVLDITSYKMTINKDNIHRLKEFNSITNYKNGWVSIEDLYNVITHKEGLFKNSKGEKILFINKVENKYYEEISKKLAKLLEEHNIKIICGSIKNKVFKLLKG